MSRRAPIVTGDPVADAWNEQNTVKYIIGWDDSVPLVMERHTGKVVCHCKDRKFAERIVDALNANDSAYGGD